MDKVSAVFFENFISTVKKVRQPNLTFDGYFEPSIWAFDAHRKLISIAPSDIFRWVDYSAMGPLTTTRKITEFYSEGFRLNELKKGWRAVDDGDEPPIPIGVICRTGWRLDSNTCTYDCETSIEALI